MISKIAIKGPERLMLNRLETFFLDPAELIRKNGKLVAVWYVKVRSHRQAARIEERLRKLFHAEEKVEREDFAGEVIVRDRRRIHTVTDFAYLSSHLRDPLFFRRRLAELKMIPLREFIINRYKLPHNSTHILCPFHDDKNPSLSVFSVEKEGRLEWRFKCFGCGASGTIIDFVMKAEGKNFQQAVEAIEKYLSGEGGEVVQIEVEKLSSKKNHTTQQSAAAVLARAMRERDEKGISKNIIKYMESSRGFSPPPLCKLYTIDELDAIIAPLSFPELRGIRTDPIGQKNKQIEWEVKAVERLIFDGRRWKKLSLGRKSEGLYFPQPEIFPQASAVLAVEGVFDALAVQRALYDHCRELYPYIAVAATTGSTNLKPLKKLISYYSEKIYILHFDRDESGEKAAREITEYIRTQLSEEVVCRVLPVPEGKDPNDSLKALKEKYGEYLDIQIRKILLE